MTCIEGRAPGSSTSSPSEKPKAWEIAELTASVGFTSQRSIWLSIERFTPQASGSLSSDQ